MFTMSHSAHPRLNFQPPSLFPMRAAQKIEKHQLPRCNIGLLRTFSNASPHRRLPEGTAGNARSGKAPGAVCSPYVDNPPYAQSVNLDPNTNQQKHSKPAPSQLATHLAKAAAKQPPRQMFAVRVWPRSIAGEEATKSCHTQAGKTC